MALLNTVSSEYYKVLYDKSSVRAGKVFVVVRPYASQNEREKEKARETEIQNSYEILMKAMNDSEGKLKAFVGDKIQEKSEFEELVNQNTEMKNVYNKYLSANLLLQKISSAFYKAEGDEMTSDINAADLENFGISNELVTDPIILGSEFEINCGEYAGENIDLTLFYNRLKNMTFDPCVDCL